MYWGISESFLDSCCYEKFIGRRELVVEQMEVNHSHLKHLIDILSQVNSRKVKKEDEDDFGDGKFARYQKMIWDLMEKPESSTAAQASINHVCFVFRLYIFRLCQ